MSGNKIKLLTQGSYGCVFKPGMKCNGRVDSDKFITKIQKEENNGNETNIGNKIKTIKKYQSYFAPILESCNISIGNIEDDEINKCEVIDNKFINYVSNKIKYVGKYTLADYLIILYKEKPKLFLRTFIVFYIELLKSTSILFKNNILHLDLKENNIMVDENLEKPIVIDFGLSVDTTNLNAETYKDIFFVYGYDYPPWCFDISIISYVVNEIGFLHSNIASISELEKICTNFVEKNVLFKNDYIFDKSEIAEYKTKLIQYVSRFEGKPWNDILNEFLKFTYSWDTYAIHVIFLFLMQDMELKTFHGYPFMKYFYSFLKSNVTAMPEERMQSIDCRRHVKSLFNNIKKTDANNILNQFKLDSKNAEKMLSKSQNISESQLAELKKEEDIYKFL